MTFLSAPVSPVATRTPTRALFRRWQLDGTWAAIVTALQALADACFATLSSGWRRVFDREVN